MKYVRDTTGRFDVRPHFEPGELDDACETLITEFVQERYGTLILPLPTDALTKLIERDAADLDLYADLSHEGPEVEGVTYFFPIAKPRVCIAAHLSEGDPSEHRLRTTLTHEYGHVRFHAPLYIRRQHRQLELFPDVPDVAAAQTQRCHRAGILHAVQYDWMEWQAGYACGALLMPRSQLWHLVRAFFADHGLYGPQTSSSPEARALCRVVSQRFGVSQEAARVRLTKLNYLTDQTTGPSLYS